MIYPVFHIDNFLVITESYCQYFPPNLLDTVVFSKKIYNISNIYDSTVDIECNSGVCKGVSLEDVVRIISHLPLGEELLPVTLLPSLSKDSDLDDLYFISQDREKVYLRGLELNSKGEIVSRRIEKTVPVTETIDNKLKWIGHWVHSVDRSS